MNTDLLQQDLANEDMSDFHKKMLDDCRNLVDMSRRKMSSYYAQWDSNDDTYRGIKRRRDQRDKDAAARQEPEKMVVPISYSQIQTFVSFCYALYTQREKFFELLGISEEDHKAARVGEALLQRDLIYNTFDQKLFQFLLDVARFGLGVFKTCWVHEKQMVKEDIAVPPRSFLGITFRASSTVTQMSEQTKFMGNKIINISPYRFFPDTRLPLSRFQEGEFVASEDEYTITTLKRMEKDGEVFGVDHIKPISNKELERRGVDSRYMDDDLDKGMLGAGQSKGKCVVTEVQRVIIPSQYMIDDETPLGEEDYPVKYVIWYANDSRVIKCEPMYYAHDQFTYDLQQFNPDQHNLINDSLADSINMLQDTISWFINSRITSVRKVISNWLIVDPEGVEIKDIENRRPVIRVKPAAGGRGVDRWIKQLEVNDVTTNHIVDAKYLNELVQLTTGISENILGQFHQGRRSATEARNVTSNAAARLKMIATLIFVGALEPMARKMLSNLRDGLDEETIVRIMGLQPAVEGAAFKPVTKADLIGRYDFEVFDATLPSEKILGAQALSDLLLALMKSPEAAIALGMDPKAILLEVLELRGVRNPERFTLRQPPQLPGAPNGQPGQPDPNAGGDNGQSNGFSGLSEESVLSGAGGNGQTGSAEVGQIGNGRRSY